MLWSLHCFVLFSFVFYMNYHLYFIWIVIHCSYTEAIMFLIIELLLLKWILCISWILCVEVMCVHRATWENSQWLNVLPCINILEKKKIALLETGTGLLGITWHNGKIIWHLTKQWQTLNSISKIEVKSDTLVKRLENSNYYDMEICP